MLEMVALAAGHPYVILTSGRDGSTLLCEKLALPHVRCDMEFLAGHEGNTSQLMNVAREARLPCDAVNPCKRDFFRPLLNAYFHSCPAGQSCGFKVFPTHLPNSRKQSLEFLAQHVKRVVVLERANKTQQYFSLAHAQETGLWGSWQRGKPVPVQERLPDFRKHVSMDDYVADQLAWYSEYRHIRGVPLLNVYYEDLVDVKKQPLVTSRVAAFIQHS